jgi:hypothetical protein
MFQRHIETAVDIMATPARVWDILTDFPAFPVWNPFIVSAYGKPETGAWLELHYRTRTGRALMVRPTVIVAERERELRWRGRLLFPGLFQGDHFFRIEEHSGTVHFIHGETFSGLAVGLMPDRLRATHRGFDAMNTALKKRAEAMN